MIPLHALTFDERKLVAEQAKALLAQKHHEQRRAIIQTNPINGFGRGYGVTVTGIHLPKQLPDNVVRAIEEGLPTYYHDLMTLAALA